MSEQVYTHVYCAVCNEPVKLVDVVREGGHNYHKDCLKKAKGSCLWTGAYEPDISDNLVEQLGDTLKAPEDSD